MRTTATAGMVNGGGFVTGASGTDFSMQDAAQYNLTGVTSAGAGNVILSASAASDMIGNIAHVISGTNFNAGWYEITGVTVGVDITLGTRFDGASACSGVGANGVVNIGGAVDLTGSLCDSFFEGVNGGNTVWIKTGSYTLGSSVTVTTALASGTANAKWYGYKTTRGDNPSGTDRPSITCGTVAISVGGNWTIKNLDINGSSTTVLTTATDSWVENCAMKNESAVSGRAAHTSGSAFCINNEYVSQNGNAVNMTANVVGKIFGCNIHDSDVGIVFTTGTHVLIAHNIIRGMVTAGINCTTGTTPRTNILNNTIVGSKTSPIGTGIMTGGATSSGILIVNNILTHLSTGVNISTVQQDSVHNDYNDFYANTTDRTNCETGDHSLTVDPGYVAFTEISGSTATISTNTLTQTGAFSTVTDGQYIHVTGGTGATVGIYRIVSHTSDTVTTVNTIGTNATADKTWFICTSDNFAVTGAV